MTDTSSIPTTDVFPTTRAQGCPFDPAVGYAELRASEGLPKVSCPAGMDAYVLSGYDQVRDLLNDPRLSSRGAVSNHVVVDTTSPPRRRPDPSSTWTGPRMRGYAV